MSLSDRRTVLTGLAALTLTGCGFAPAFGPGGAAAGLMGSVAMDAPTSKDEFDLVERLEERLGRTGRPAYRLGYKVKTTSTGLGITSANTTTRYQVTGTIEYTLRDARDDSAVTTGKVSTFTSYGASGTVVATVAAERAAHERLMRLLADQIVTRLIAAGAGRGGT